jgi:primosomal protein N' (replication factor Y)
MDQDTTRGRNAHHKLLEQFRQRQASVLLGTQMVAKGLDFPNVTLVGVISADIGLDFPDFRAAERTFQLLTQVAGRTGRGDKPGYVIVQTSRPEDPVIQAASRHDVDGFVATELEKRRDLEYPPFGRLVLLQLRGIDNDAVRTNAEALAAFATNRAGDLIEVLGPTEAPIPRIKKHWRWQVLLKGTSSSHLRSVAKTVQRFHEKRRERAVQLSIDVDPITML